MSLQIVREGVDEVDWQLLRARSSALTLRVGGRLTHSQYDPERDAERWAEQLAAELAREGCDLWLAIGSGLGVGLRALAERSRAAALVWEPFPRLCAAVSDASESVTAPVVHTPDALEAALDRLLASARRPRLLIHPGYEHATRFEARYAARSLRARLAPERETVMAERIVSARALAALGQLPESVTVADLAGSLESHTAIVASGGPSLTAALPALAGRSGGALFACIQVLDALGAAGVSVDFAVSIDPANLFRRRRVQNENYRWLLADTSSQPDMLGSRTARTCLYHVRSPHLHELAWRRCGLPVLDEPLLTVSEVSLMLAHQLGARSFVLAGVDLASADPRYGERFATRDARGDVVPTNSHYFHAARYLDWQSRRLAAEGCEILRVGSGLAIAGARSIDEHELACRLASLPAFEAAVQRRSDRRAERGRVVREVLAPLARSPLSHAVEQAAAAHRAQAEASGRREPAGSEPLPPSEIPARAAAVLRGLEA